MARREEALHATSSLPPARLPPQGPSAVLSGREPPRRAIMSETEPALSRDNEADRGPQLRLALTAIYAALTLVALDGAIVNVALPTIAQALRVSAAASVAVATSYQLAVVISLAALCRARRKLWAAQGVRRRRGPVHRRLGRLRALDQPADAGGGAVRAGARRGRRSWRSSRCCCASPCPKERLAEAIGWNAVAVALAGAAGPSVGALILSVAGLAVAVRRQPADRRAGAGRGARAAGGARERGAGSMR